MPLPDPYADAPFAPFAIFERDDGGAWLLSGLQAALDEDLAGEADPAGALASLLGRLEAASRQGEWVALAADYALGAACDPALLNVAHGARRLRAWRFAHAQALSAEALDAWLAARLAALSEAERCAGVAELTPALSEPEYTPRVEQVQRWIADGECYQINLTFPLDLKVYGHPLALYAALRTRQPVRYGAFIAAGAGQATLLSRSPELFFERQGTRVVTRPMKGTAPRGVDAVDDEARRVALQASPKERAENVMIVDLLRNDLGRLAAPGSVRVEALCASEAYPTLWQMVLTVAAELPGVSLAEIFAALFPCGSITGAPKIRAMQLIDRLEARPRGVYTGAIGYLAPGGDCRFNVAIRTLEIEADGRAQLGVGSGIVIDADPAREYAECLLKARFLTGFDPGFLLIETLRLDNGVYPRLEGHLARLAASARALGFAGAEVQVRAALAGVARQDSAGVRRVRLTLAHDGSLAVTHAALVEEGGRAWRAVIAPERLPDGAGEAFLRRHKTTVRGLYDAALAGLAARPDAAEVFDAIFLNARGEVCEGARSTVFVEREGVLLTPPLASGCLAGVLRAELLASGRAVEAVLTEAELRTAPAVYLGNALRGLMRVTLVE